MSKVLAVVSDLEQAETRQVSLSEEAGRWHAVVDRLALGGRYAVEVEGLNASGERIGSSKVDSLIQSDDGLFLHVNLFEDRLKSKEATEPILAGILASGKEVEPGHGVRVWAKTRAVEGTDVFSYQWSATCGDLANPYGVAAEWRAPDVETECDVSVVVSNGEKGKMAGKIPFKVGRQIGAAKVLVAFNVAPEVLGMLASPATVLRGIPIDLTAEAKDSDVDPLVFRWLSDCPGEFTSALSAQTRFWPGTQGVSGCVLTVQVSDGRGGEAIGTLKMPSHAPQVNVAPKLGPAWQGSDELLPSGQVTLHLEATDPEGGDLRFAWSAETGSIIEARDGAHVSEALFVAPRSAVGEVLVTATATDALGASASWTFRIQVRNPLSP